MSTYELDAKVQELWDLRNIESKIKAAIRLLKMQAKPICLRKTPMFCKGGIASYHGRPLPPAASTVQHLSSHTPICSTRTQKPTQIVVW